MVKENSSTSKQVVAFAVVDRDLVGEGLCAGIRTAGLERSGFVLWCRCGAEHFARRCLIEPGFQTDVAYGFEHAEGAVRRDVTGIFWHIEADPYMALRRKVVYLIGLHLIKQAPQAGRVRKISHMEKKLAIFLVPVRVDRIDAPGIETTGAAFYAVDLVAFLQ